MFRRKKCIISLDSKYILNQNHDESKSRRLKLLFETSPNKDESGENQRNGGKIIKDMTNFKKLKNLTF